jgi:hypothetical protein
MRQILATLLFISLASGAEPGGRAEYIGGTLSRFSAGDEGRIHTLNETAMVFATKKASIGVPYERINLLEYGQNASRRVVLAVTISPLFLLTKARKHFLTVGYEDDRGKQQAIVLRIEKGHVRAVLASLEARTGLKVQFQDDEARKAGKG